MKRGTKAALLVFLLTGAISSHAGPLRQRMAQRTGGALDDGADDRGRVTLPPGVQLVRDIAYGANPLERFDVYLPAKHGAAAAPAIFMVHGGGWRRGDKAAASVVENKMAHWTAAGYVFISVNYPMLPGTQPQGQAREVARALSAAQAKAGSWGADASRFVLMGHSAGAHLVALLATSPAVTAGLPLMPFRSVVLLDSAALDVPRIMDAPHFPLYDAAFGTERSTWYADSPWHQVTKAIAPLLAVCSTRRHDSCAQADSFASRLSSLGGKASVLPVDLSHREINETLGEPSAYTDRVDRFVGGSAGGLR